MDIINSNQTLYTGGREGALGALLSTCEENRLHV